MRKRDKKFRSYQSKIKKFLPLLMYLATDEKHREIVPRLNNQVIKVISDVCQNCLSKKGLLHKQFKSNPKLQACCSDLKTLASKKGQLRKKKQILQKGEGILTSLLSIGIPALLELIK